MKKTIVFLLITVCMLIPTLTGCFGGKNRGNAEHDFTVTDPSELEGEITIALPATGTKRKMFTQVIDKYKASRPNVSVKVNWQTADDFYISYLADVTTGLVYPDAAILDHIYVQSLAADNLIADVTSVFDQEVYLDTVDKLGQWEGKYFGFPTTLNNMALFYNKDIIGDTPPSTWEEFKATCARVKSEQDKKPVAADRYYPFTMYLGSNTRLFGSMMMYSWAQRNGGVYLSEDLKTSQINSQPVIDSLTQWKTMVENGWANPTTNEEGLFYEGKVGMVELGSWVIPRIFKGEHSVANFGIAPLFTLKDDGSRSSVMGAYELVVTRQDGDMNKMKISADFGKFISEDAQFQHDYAKEGMVLPVNKAALEVDDFFSGELWKPFLDGLTGCSYRQGSPEWSYIEMEMANAISSACNGSKTPAEAAKFCSDLVQEKLDEFYNR